MTSLTETPYRDISLVLCGQAGAGVQTVETLLIRLFKQAGFHSFATKEYMSRVRGGLNSTTLRVGSSPVRATISRIDLLIPLDKGAVRHVAKRFTQNTTILCDDQVVDRSEIPQEVRCIDAPLTQLAKDIGNKIYSNIIAVGLVGALLGLDKTLMAEFIQKRFAKKDQTVIDENLRALEAGVKLGQKLTADGTLHFDLKPDPAVNSQMLISGIEAVGLGAIAGGCNFIGAYPMSPSTGLLTFLAKQGDRFGIVVEQAEDEIAGINMALGAWYAGARAIASTSGGGFALMTEGLSLAGMIESPLVVHIAQRPGPATGLPTRTGQEDLNLALYAGHGEFPRAILAPGTLWQAFMLTQHAFDLADRGQVPVFILTDQYFADTYYNTDTFDISQVSVKHSFIESQPDYLRFALTESGLSPRAIPGHGQGLVVVDSDEHDEAGHITEDLDLRTKMVDKRLRKMKLLIDESIGASLWPKQEYQHLVICWGSTFPIVQEALEQLGRDDVAILHFSQVFPLHPDTAERIGRAKTRICLEGNATGQFAQLLKRQLGIEMDEQILKYNGLQFTVEEVVESLKKILG